MFDDSKTGDSFPGGASGAQTGIGESDRMKFLFVSQELWTVERLTRRKTRGLVCFG